MVTVCAIAFIPAAYEIHEAWCREGEWVRIAVADQVCTASADVFEVSVDEVSDAWDLRGLGRTATYVLPSSCIGVVLCATVDCVCVCVGVCVFVCVCVLRTRVCWA
jgi:hypothetical protein